MWSANSCKATPSPHPDVITEAACPRLISGHPSPLSHTPQQDYSQILATSPKIKDGLYLGVCEYGS
jgi:hypothetical protein